jgi:hypothetical protein
MRTELSLPAEKRGTRGPANADEHYAIKKTGVNADTVSFWGIPANGRFWAGFPIFSLCSAFREIRNAEWPGNATSQPGRPGSQRSPAGNLRKRIFSAADLPNPIRRRIGTANYDSEKRN